MYSVLRKKVIVCKNQIEAIKSNVGFDKIFIFKIFIKWRKMII